MMCDPATHRKSVAVQCARLFAAYPAESLDAATARLRTDGYWTALHDQPTWAIESTVSAILRGQEAGVGTGWSPTPPALATAVRKRTEPILGDIRKLEAVASAGLWEDEAEPPEPKQFVIDGFADVRERIAAAEAERASESHARFLAELTAFDEKARVRECEREGVDPALGVSPSLLRLLKQQMRG